MKTFLISLFLQFIFFLSTCFSQESTFLKKESTGITQNIFFETETFHRLIEQYQDDIQIKIIIANMIRILSLTKETSEEPIFMGVLSHLSKDEFLNGSYVDLGIQILEIITQKKFNASDENAKEITIEFLRRGSKNLFHATNPNALESIKQTGLSMVIRNFDVSEIEEMDKITKLVLNPGFTLFPFLINQGNHSIYVAEDPYICLYYAEKSPEWFWLFLQRAMDSANVNSSKIDKTRSYSQIMAAMESTLQTWNDQHNGKLTAQAYQKIRNFTQKYCQQFVKPNGVILKVTLLSDNETPEAKIRKWKSIFPAKTYKDLLNETFLNCNNNYKVGEKDFPSGITAFHQGTSPISRFRSN